MAYATRNTKSKTALKRVVEAGEDIGIWQPGPFGRDVFPDGEYAIEGPHYPEPHRWYATAVVKDNKIVAVK